MSYFHDTPTETIRLGQLKPVPRAEFIAAGGVPNKANRCDAYSHFLGQRPDTLEWLPVSRYISYKRNPSRHECNAKCVNGSLRGTCECKCGGKNHGRGATI